MLSSTPAAGPVMMPSSRVQERPPRGGELFPGGNNEKDALSSPAGRRRRRGPGASPQSARSSQSVQSEKSAFRLEKSSPRPDGGESRKTHSAGKNAPGGKEKTSPRKMKTPPPPLPEILPVPEEEGKIRFTDLDLAPEILAGTQTLGFRYCTEIQGKCLPYALSGKDLAAKAQTGTGKTAAFLASSMTHLLRHPLQDRKPGEARVLVLAPTRELAIQIHKDAEALGLYTQLNNLVVFGGMDHKAQRDSLQDPVDILVGTPGRIIDYSRSGDLDLSHVEILVIDEADRMLDMGFIPDVRRIVSKLPPTPKRQTMLFSATLEPEILRLVDRWLSDPVSVESEPEHVVTDLIEQKFYAVLDDQKLPMLLSVLKTENPGRVIIFGNRKDKNRSLVRKLYAYGIDAELLSGDIAQEKRLKILERFRSGATRILVATDVAARGIHVEGITHVINYDLPEQADDYVHRIGRTGRAGAKGVSISFVCEYGAYVMPDIEKYIDMKVTTVQPEDAMLVLPEKVRSEPSPGSDSSCRRGGSHGGSYGGGRGPSSSRSSSSFARRNGARR